MKPTPDTRHPAPSFAIGIPTLNRWDLLRPALQKYLVDFPGTDIFIFDNGFQAIDLEHDNLLYIIKKENQGVAAAWNSLCANIFLSNYTHALILNDDIELGKKQADIQKLVMDSPSTFLVTMKDWCAFIVPKIIFNKIGEFDTIFKCYYEDADYAYRLKLDGLRHIKTSQLTPSIYRENGTAEKEPLVHKWALQSKQKYIEKWGGVPGQEKYTRPYNGRLAIL